MAGLSGLKYLLAISAVCIKGMTVCQKWKCLCPRTLNLAIATLNDFFFFYHLFFQHPYIYPPSFTTCNSEGIITVRNFLMNGTLRDFLCNVSRFHFWIFTSLGNHFILASSYTMRFRALCVSFTSSPLGSGLTLYFSRFDINSSTFIVTNTDVLFLSEYFSESFA